MLHTIAALSSGLRCASGSGSGRSSPCPSVFSSSEGEGPLSRSVDSFIFDVRPVVCRRRELDDERHSG